MELTIDNVEQLDAIKCAVSQERSRLSAMIDGLSEGAEMVSRLGPRRDALTTLYGRLCDVVAD